MTWQYDTTSIVMIITNSLSEPHHLLIFEILPTHFTDTLHGITNIQVILKIQEQFKFK